MEKNPVNSLNVTFNRLHSDVLRLQHRQVQINRYLSQKLINRKAYNEITESIQKKIKVLNSACAVYTDLIQEQILR